jgi:hypothetical protein
MALFVIINQRQGDSFLLLSFFFFVPGFLAQGVCNWDPNVFLAYYHQDLRTKQTPPTTGGITSTALSLSRGDIKRIYRS